MYAALYNRLCGWLLIGLALIGYTTGHVGDYIAISGIESNILLGLGIIAIIGARSRTRYAVPLALLVGVLLVIWGVIGMTSLNALFGSSDPLESALRVVVGGWGVYVGIQDFLQWRNEKSS